MYRIVSLFGILGTIAECATYHSYGEMTTPYPTYSTVANLFNQFPSKTTYDRDVVAFPEATRYTNSEYNPGYSTRNSYTTTNGYYKDTYGNQRYGELGQSYGQNFNQKYGQSNGYGQSNIYGQKYGQNFGQNYGINYGQNYGQNYGGYNTYERPFLDTIDYTNSRDYCVNRVPQKDIWVENIMGMWYGVEMIQHLAGDSRVDLARSCIVIHISEPKDKPSTDNQVYHVQYLNAQFNHENRHLRILWDEEGQRAEYSLFFRNDSTGYWQAYNGQNGTLASLPRYQQFHGSVQVLKAVNDHLVLHFCQEARHGRPAQLYSVLFSRDPGAMPHWEVESIHALLLNKKLSVASRRMVCGNSAVKLLHNAILSVIMFVLANFNRHS